MRPRQPRGASRSTSVSLTVDQVPVRTIGDEQIELESEVRVRSIRWERPSTERVVQVPRFDAQGRVLRTTADDGGDNDVTIQVCRPRALVELEHPRDGLEIWFGKMTDG